MRKIEKESRAINSVLKTFGARNVEKVVFTLPEAARRIGISMVALRRLILDGTLRAVRPRRTMLITAHQVERYCRRNA